MFTNFVHEALEIVAVVSSLDCCLFNIAASLTSVFVFIDDKKIFLDYFVANNFVP